MTLSFPKWQGPTFVFALHFPTVLQFSCRKNSGVVWAEVPIPGLYTAGDSTRGIMVPGDVGVVIEGIFSALAYDIAGEETVKRTVLKKSKEMGL